MPADPLARARHAAAQMDTHRAALARLADERAHWIREAVMSGMRPAEVARALGISRQAVAQVLSRRDPLA